MRELLPHAEEDCTKNQGISLNLMRRQWKNVLKRGLDV